MTKKMEKVGLAAKGAAKEKEEPRYTKKIMKKGDGSTFPRKGDTVGCFYKGTLADGTVFDTNMGGSCIDVLTLCGLLSFRYRLEEKERRRRPVKIQSWNWESDSRGE